MKEQVQFLAGAHRVSEQRVNLPPLTYAMAFAGTLLLLSSCAGTSVNPTGLMGGQTMCPSGPRPTIDCRGVLQQYSRDFKLDLNVMSKVTVSPALTTTQLTQADALTSDLLQHSYQNCTLYNACIVSPQDYAAKAAKLEEAQLSVRRTLAGGVYGQQQNIQINPVPGSPFPPQAPGVVPPPPFPGGAPVAPFPGGGVPAPGGPAPGVPYSGANPSPFPQTGANYPPTDPNLQQAQPYLPQAVAQAPLPNQTASPTTSANIPNTAGTTGNKIGDTVLAILTDAVQVLRSTNSQQPGSATPAPTRSVTAPPAQDLDSALKAMLLSLKQNVVNQNPSLASGHVVVGNFTEEGQPWGGPMGALLQDRVSSIVTSDSVFNQTTNVQTRGISVKEVAAVANANDPKALTTLYNADLAITGTYQPQGDMVAVKLVALQNAGEIAEVTKGIPANSIPDVVAASAQNATATDQLLSSFNQIGPKVDAKISITTNRPGQGSSFRLGDEIKYFVKSGSNGYLYLFHIDGDKNVEQIFPNQYQRDAKIQSGQVVQVPADGAPFKFEASPPFGLETTFAIVTASPLDEKDLQAIRTSFTNAKQEAPGFLKSRGINIVSSAPSTPGGSNSVLWNSTTVLIRP